MAREDWQTAIARFRAMLIRDPTLPRVRLDLALAYFRAEEDGSAAYHFRQVLGDKDLPPIVRARTLAFLDTIRRRKTWSVSAAAALAPTAISMPRQALGRSTCLASRPNYRRTRGKPAGWA